MEHSNVNLDEVCMFACLTSTPTWMRDMVGVCEWNTNTAQLIACAAVSSARVETFLERTKLQCRIFVLFSDATLFVEKRGRSPLDLSFGQAFDWLH